MSNLINHAINELRASGWITEDGKYLDEMGEAMCKDVLALLELFASQGHSGSTAPHAIELFSKLAKFEPLTPLTGEDWEWVDVAEQSGYPLYQNKRCGHVFKDSERAYDVNGTVFWEWYNDSEGMPQKVYFTSKDSHTTVTFPYTPTTEYREWKEEEHV